MIEHHPSDDLLLGYTTGTLPYPMEAIVAAHLTLCPRCRATNARLEAVGGNLFEELGDDTLPAGGVDDVFARLDKPKAAPSPAAMAEDPDMARLVPAPLRDMASGPLKSLTWREPLRGVSVVDLASIEEDGAKARLVRTRAGGHLPEHKHGGTELTLVLAGGLTDQHGHFRRGDLLAIEPGEVHRPVMDDDEDCLCFGVTDGEVRMTGVINRLRQILGGY